MIKNFYFFTATNLGWKHILKSDKYEDIIIESFKFLVTENRLRIFAFVIMPNHLHAVWRINKALEKSDFQRDMLKFTSQTIFKRFETLSSGNTPAAICRCKGQKISVMGKKSFVSTIVYAKGRRAENKLNTLQSCKS